MNRLAIVSKERISEELLKGFSTDAPHIYYNNLYATGVLQALIPEFGRADDFKHSNYGTHTGESIHEHTYTVLSRLAELPPSPEIYLAGMLHDIGKLCGTQTISPDGRIHYYDHEMIGATRTHEILRTYRFSNDTVAFITSVVKNHMRLHAITDYGKAPLSHQKKHYAMMYVELGENDRLLRTLSLLARADAGNNETDITDTLLMEYLETPRVIKGKDVEQFPAYIRGHLIRRMRYLQLRHGLNREALLKNYLASEANNLKEALPKPKARA
jgi:tRNA nucleotidyltransferase/poly(A) polymerase